MADVRTALLDLLRGPTDDASKRDELRATLDGVELDQARLQAKDEPASADALAAVLGCMLLADAASADVVDAAKAAAQRAPRDEAGHDVLMLAAAAVRSLSDQPRTAEPYVRRVRRNAPNREDVLQFYRALFDDDSSATQLIQVLVQARRASTDPQQRFDLAAEVADIAANRLQSADRAIEMWRAVLREDGYDERAASALMRLYRDSGKWTALVELLKEEVDRLGEDPQTRDRRIELLLEIANLYRERLNLDTMALAKLQQILDIDPGHEQSLEALTETYANAGRWNDLLGVYARRIASAKEAGDEERHIELLRRVAEIWVERVGNPQRALEPLSQVLALRPRDREARGLLARIHEQRRDFRALIALRREDLEELDGEEALALRIELAKLAEERLGDRREAIEAWNEVLTHHGDVDQALAALARLYERESRWAQAAEIIHRKLGTCGRDQAVALLHHLGGLYSDRLHSREDAVAVWSELLRLQPGHDKATRRLRDAHVAERRWDELTALYEGQGRLQEVVDVLHSAADRISDVTERVALYRRVASLCQERLGQPERALKALERTLAIAPDNLDVARELVPIYREQSNWARLMSTYEVLLSSAQNDDERLELISAMREIAEHRLASPSLTMQWAAEAYRIHPHDEELRDSLESAAERADGWDELTRIFEERIEAAGVSEEEQLTLLGKLAVIARDRLFKPDDAQRYFRRITALNPTNEGAMSALEEIYTTTRRWEDLAEVYERRLGVTEDPRAQLTTLRALARLQEEQIGDLDGATRSYERILELDAEDRQARTSLARIHRNRGNWAELATTLQAQLDRADSNTTRIPLVYELAQIQATRLQDSDRAVEGFLEVLDLDPNHRDAVEALETLRQSDPAVQLDVMRGLLPYYRRVDDRAKEAEAMEVLVAAEDDPQRRLKLLEQLAGSYEKMNERRDDALRIRLKLFESDPSQWQGRQLVQRLGAELGRLSEVAAAYEAALRELSQAADAADAEGRMLSRDQATLRRDLQLEYAGMLRDALQRPDEAERAFAEVLEVDETHTAAYEALQQSLEARHAHEELVALYRRRVDVTFNPAEQRELLSRIIELARNTLGDRQTAIETAEELLDLIPDDLATIALLGQMYAEGNTQEDYEKLEEILGRQAELTDDPAAARLLRVRRASLRMQYLGDAFGAVDLLGQVVGEDPSDIEARRLLEELLSISEVQLQACALLEPIYEQIGDYEGRIRVLSVRREQAEMHGAADEAVGYLMQIAALRENEQGDPVTALEAVREAYLMDPTRFDTRQEVERLGMGLQRHAELADVWRAALDHERVTDSALRIDLTTRLARLLDGQLRDQEQAREAYASLLALDPPDATLAQEAVTALCRLHLEAGDFVALIDARRELLRFVDSLPRQVEIRLEIAKIQLEMRDRVEAALTFSEVLDRQPDNEQALSALEQLFAEEREWRRLVEVLEHRISVTNEPRARAAMWRRIGELQRDRLGDPVAALGAFQSVVDLKVGREDTAQALSALIDLHEQAERWPDVEENLRRLTTIAEHTQERVELLTRTAVVVGKHLGRGQDALDLLKRVLDLSPTDPRARSEVTAYLEQDDTRERAIRILAPLYEAEQNWPALVSLEELQARKQPSGRRRLQALLRVAQTQEDRIGDVDKAFTVLCEGMTEAADQPELEDILARVERLGADEGRAERLLEAYEATVDHILDAALQKRVLLSIGEVALSRLGRLLVARKAYERVLDLTPDDTEAVDALEQIYLRQDEYEPLAELLVSRADRATDTAERDEVLIRGAEIYRRSLDRPEDAIQLYERLSSEALAKPSVQEVLEPLYEATGRWRELAAHLNRKLATLRGKEAVSVHLRLGRLYGNQLDDPETGIRHLSAAIKLDPDEAVATEELDRYLDDESMRSRVAEMLEPVFAAIADWQRLIQIQEIRLGDVSDDADRMRLLLRIAQIEEEQLEDLDRAYKSYERLFREQPKAEHVRDQLARLAQILSQTEAYATLLTEYVQGEAAADDSDEMLAVVREAADLWAGPLRQPKRAVPLLRRILQAQPQPANFAALEAALIQGEMWSELAEAYWQEIDAGLDEERQLELLRRLAILAQESLEDLEEAARAYRRMLDIRPDHALARSRLEQIYTEIGKNDELLELLRERLSRTETAEARGDVSLRIAQLQDGPLDDPDGAVDTVEAMLLDLPDDPQAVQMLEFVAQRRRELRRRILSILRPIYERHGNIRRIVEIDEWELGQTEDPGTRQELYREIAELLSRHPDTTEGAFRALCRALAEPGPVDMLERLDADVAQMAERLQMREGLADALVAAATSQRLESDVDRRIDLRIRAASLKLELSDASAAAEILRPALEERDDDAAVLRLMDQALTKLGFHEEAATVLRKRAEVAEDDRERVELLRRLATLFEEVLARPPDAEQAWKDLLFIEPEDREALQRLSRVYEASGSTDELVEVLERRIEATTDGAERRDLRMQLANLHRETRKDREAEIDTLRSLLAEAPEDDDALAALARALVAAERHAEAADTVQERASLAENADRKATLLLEAARLYSGPLADVPSALERYEQVLGLMPGQEGALGDLVELARSQESFEAAGALVAPQLEAVGRYEDLATVLAARAEFTVDPDEKANALRSLASIRLERLDDAAGALEAYDQLLDDVVEDELQTVLEHVGRLCTQLGRASAQFERLAERSASLDRDGPSRVRIGMFAATIAEEVIGQPEQALAVLVDLVQGGVARKDVCDRVERLGRAVENLEAVELALREASRMGGESLNQSGTLVRLGRVQLERGELGEALESFRDGFEAGAENDAIRGLEDLVARAGADVTGPMLDALDSAYQSTGDRAGQARVAAKRLQNASDTEQPALLEHLATLRDQGGGTPAEALEAWGELLALDPDSEPALERVVALARDESSERLQRAAALMLEAIERSREAGMPATTLILRTAELLLRDLRDPQATLECLAPVLDEQPDSSEGLALQIAAAREAGEYQKLHDALERSARTQADPDRAVALWADAATVAEDSLGNPQQAIEDLEELLRVDEGHVDSWRKLMALVTASGDYERLVEVIGRRVTISDDASERRELRHRTANVLVDKLERPDDAVAVYQDMLTDQPDDVGAMKELEVLLRSQEKWEDVRELLERKLEIIDSDERIGVLQELAQLSEHRLDDRHDAIERYQQLVGESPGHETEAALERLLQQEERWLELSELFERRAQRFREQGDVEGYRHSSSRLAEVLADHLDHPERAKEILDELLEHDPGYVPALLAKAAVYEATGEEGAVQLTLSRALELAPAGKEGAQLHLRLARLAKDDPAKRKEHLNQALQLDPGNAQAAEELLALARRDEDWSQVAYLLELMSARVEDPQRKRELAIERVDIMLGHLQDADGALRILAPMYQEVQDDVEVNRRIADGLFAADRYEEAAGMYSWLVEVGRRDKRNKILAHHLTRLAQISLRSENPNGAKERLLEAYRIDTTNVETLMALGTVHEHEQDWKEALKVYRTMLLQNADQSGLLRRGDIYIHLARAHVALQELPKAKAMLRRGLEEDAEHPKLATELAALEE